MEQLLNKGHSWKGLVLENLEIVSSVIRRQPASPPASSEQCSSSPGAPCLQTLPLHGHGEPLAQCPGQEGLPGQPSAQCFESLAADLSTT